MSTWTETVNYIKSQLRPGVMGNTNVQKILNSVLAVIQQINAGDFSPTPDALWKADVTYAADIQPVLWQDQWLVSNIADNLGNVPISSIGVVHPSWRLIGSSAGSGIRPWQAIVYPNTLEIVFQTGQLYYLDRGVVGIDPFVSVDFGIEFSEGKWVSLLDISSHNQLAGLQGGDSEEGEYFHLTAEEHQKVKDLQDPAPVDGVSQTGTVSFNSPTDVDVDGWKWIIAGVEYVGGDQNLPSITGTPTDYSRIDYAVGDANGDVIWVTGPEDPDQLIDPAIPAGAILLARVIRTPAGDNTPEVTPEDLSDFVSKSATGTEIMQGSLAIGSLSDPDNPSNLIQVDTNGKIIIVRADRYGSFATRNLAVGFSRLARINTVVSGGPAIRDFQFKLDILATLDGDVTQRGELYCALINDGTGTYVSSVLEVTGDLNPAVFKLVKVSATAYDLFHEHLDTKAILIYRPFALGPADRYIFYRRETILASLPAGDQYSFSEAGGGTSLDPDIVDALEASLTDSPSSSNRYVTVNLLNSYAYVQDAPTDGSHYARKDGSWVAFTPFTVAGTPSEGQVVTYVSGVPTWATPSGGGGNFIAYDVSQSLTESQRQRALDNIGDSSGSVETFTNSGVTTVNNLTISKSFIEFRGSSTVTLTGIIALWVGQEITLYNETNNDLTISGNSGSSSALNQILNSTVIPNRAAIKLKYVNLGGQQRWIITGHAFFYNQNGAGIFTKRFTGIGGDAVSAVGLNIYTTSSVGLRITDSTGSVRIFETTANRIRSNVSHGFGNIDGQGLSMAIKPLSYNICVRIFDSSNQRQVDIMGNGNWQSKGGAIFGAADTGNIPTSRVDIRGTGTGATRTLLLEDSGGTDNAIFYDNGNIDFLRLPTSDPLVAGRLWNDSGVIKISAG